MNNPRIAELLKGCREVFREEIHSNQRVWKCGLKDEFYHDIKIPLCLTCKAELKGILGQMKCEVEFLENDIDGINSCLTDEAIEKKLEELNSDIKTIEEALK